MIKYYVAFCYPAGDLKPNHVIRVTKVEINVVDFH